MTLRTSTLRRLVRRTAYIRRFFYNFSHKKSDWWLELLTEEEEEEALWGLIRREQACFYEPELKALRNKNEGMPVKVKSYVSTHTLTRVVYCGLAVE